MRNAVTKEHLRNIKVFYYQLMQKIIFFFKGVLKFTLKLK